MKVKELIKLLKQYDGDLDVIDNYDRFFNSIVEVKLYENQIILITCPLETNRLKSLEILDNEDEKDWDSQEGLAELEQEEIRRYHEENN